MEKYTIYCTEEQTKKAHELGAPIAILHNSIPEYKNPTAEQMISWLETQGLFITIDKSDGGHIFYKILKETKYVCEWNSFSSRKEATLAAIDAALEYLEKQNKKED